MAQKLNLMLFSLVAVAILIQLASAQSNDRQQQQQQPSAQQQQGQQGNNPNCPFDRLRASLNNIRSSLPAGSQSNAILDQMMRSIPQSSDSGVSSGISSKTPLTRRRREVGDQSFGQPLPSRQSSALQQQMPSANDPMSAADHQQQNQQLQQQTSRLQALMQSIQYNITPEQMQQIIVTLIMILVTLFTGPAMAAPGAAIIQQVLKQVLPVIVNSLMAMTSQFSASHSAAAIGQAPIS